jgi:hypothetical protein
MSTAPLDEQIRSLTEGGKLLVDYQIKVLKLGVSSSGFDPQLVQAAQRAADWLTQRGWGKAPDAEKEDTKARNTAASPLTTEQLLEILKASP